MPYTMRYSMDVALMLSSAPVAHDGPMESAMTTATKSKTAPKKKPAIPAPTGRPVVVTTAHRGVFFGYADDTDGETITLREGRLCVYWSADVRGFMGLAATGPTRGCRIGPPATIAVRAVTAVLECTPAAVAAWEAAPWA